MSSDKFSQIVISQTQETHREQKFLLKFGSKIK